MITVHRGRSAANWKVRVTPEKHEDKLVIAPDRAAQVLEVVPEDRLQVVAAVEGHVTDNRHYFRLDWQPIAQGGYEALLEVGLVIPNYMRVDNKPLVAIDLYVRAEGIYKEPHSFLPDMARCLFDAHFSYESRMTGANWECVFHLVGSAFTAMLDAGVRVAWEQPQASKFDMKISSQAYVAQYILGDHDPVPRPELFSSFELITDSDSD